MREGEIMSSQTESPPAGSEPRRRKVLHAVLLAVFAGLGAGQLYNGNPRRALGAAALAAGALLTTPASALVPPDSGPGLALGVALAAVGVLVALGIVVDAGLGARRIRAIPPGRLYPVWAYILIFLASAGAIQLMTVSTRAVAIRSAYSVPGASMTPTLVAGDLFFGFHGYYAAHAPRRGEIVVLQTKDGRPYAGNGESGTIAYVKRVIGLPGETVQMWDGILYIDNVPVDRQFIEPMRWDDGGGQTRDVPQYLEAPPDAASYRIVEQDGDNGRLDSTEAVTVPPGHVFLMGDNRDNSVDSRMFGPVPLASLSDRAEIVYWSENFGRIGLWLHPD